MEPLLFGGSGKGNANAAEQGKQVDLYPVLLSACRPDTGKAEKIVGKPAEACRFCLLYTSPGQMTTAGRLGWQLSSAISST